MFKKIISLVRSADFWPIVFVLVAGILSARTLIFQPGYFNMHDDLQIMRQLEMEKCFLDGQIPCRWVPDMGYGFGFPLFNFYPPLPYLVGQIIRIFGFSFVATAKISFALSLILSGLSMYVLGKKFFGSLGGVVASVFYIWAPYHAVDVYVRGAMNEAWALVFFPLIFYSSYKLITESLAKKSKTTLLLLMQSLKPDGNMILLALSWCGLFLSHNLMVLITAPFFAIWCLIWLFKDKKWLLFPKLVFSGLWALGLSMFFTLPAVLENKYTWLKSQLVGYYDYSAHFVSLKQLLITRFWGYGPSVWIDAEDGMSFQAGHFHWILSIVVFVLLLIVYKTKKKLGRNEIIISFFLFLGWVASFLTHVRSVFIYKLVSILGYVQFPWRFLTLVIFAFSLLAGSLFVSNNPNIFKNSKLKILLSFLLMVSLIAFNWVYFLPQTGKMGKLTDAEKLTSVAWDMQQTAGIYDYLPIWAKEAPKAPQGGVVAEIIKGQGLILSMQQGTNWANFGVLIDSDEAQIRINIFKYPGWKVYVDEKEINYYVPENEKWGRMWIDVPQGEHKIEAKFSNTFLRTVANLISIFSWAYLLLQFKRGGRKTLRPNPGN